MKYDQAKAIIWYPETRAEAKIQEAVRVILKTFGADPEDRQRAEAMKDPEAH